MLSPRLSSKINNVRNATLSDSPPPSPRGSPRNDSNASKWSTLRFRVHTFLEDPASSKYAFLYQLLQIVVILLSATTTVIESLPVYWGKNLVAVTVLEAYSFSIFLFDYVGRAVTSPSWSWFFELFNVIDFVVLIPFIVDFATTGGNNIAGLGALRILRIMRIAFLLVKITRYPISIVVVIVVTLKKSRQGFLMFLVGFGFLLMICSTMMFFAEQTVSTFVASKRVWVYNSDDSISPFQSILHCMWWCIATMTTVGYGDSTPRSAAGRIVAAFTMICSTFVLTLPMSVFLVHFTEAYANQRQVKAQKRDKVDDTEVTLSEKETISSVDLLRELQLWKEEIQKTRVSLAKLEKRRAKLVALLEDTDHPDEATDTIEDCGEDAVVISAATFAS